MEEKTKDLETELSESKGDAEAKATVILSLEQAEDEWKVKVIWGMENTGFPISWNPF